MKKKLIENLYVPAYMFPEEVLVTKMVKYCYNEWREMMVVTIFDPSIQSFIVKYVNHFLNVSILKHNLYIHVM